MNRYELNRRESHEVYKWALRRVQAKMVFRWHFLAFLIGASLLILINVVTLTLPGFPAYYWCIWPVAGWIITLLIHFAQVYLFAERCPDEMRHHLLDRELARLNK